MWLFERAGKKNSNNTNYQFWQQNNQPIMLTKESKVYEIVDYIHNNPVVAGIVRFPDEIAVRATTLENRSVCLM
jgi:putative transposase